jgi:phosphate transport system permease protein
VNGDPKTGPEPEVAVGEPVPTGARAAVIQSEVREAGGVDLSASGLGRTRRIRGAIFGAVCLLATLVGVVALLILFQDLLRDGVPQLSLDFIRNFASRIPERAGIRSPLVGSIYIVILTALIAFPVAVAAAVYLEEYAPKNWVTRLIQLNIANLAGVPSIVYGILGLALFVRGLGLGRSLISGALTLSILILPVIVIAAQEAVRAVPSSIREAAYGLGATRWQVVRHQVLPMAMPGIMTGTILALSRAVGETAPLIMIGAVTFIAFTPQGLTDQFTVLPLQIYDWISRPQEAYRMKAAGAIVVLLAILMTMNGVAIYLRNRFQTRR